GRTCSPRDIRIVSRIKRDAGAAVVAGSAEIGRIHESRTETVQLKYVGFLTAPTGSLKAVDDGKVIRLRVAGNIRIASGVDGDAACFVGSGSANVRGIDELGARRIKLENKRIGGPTLVPTLG